MSDRTVILTGGAGYLGRCTAVVLAREGCAPVLVDNLSTSPPPAAGFPFHRVELTDLAATRAAWKAIGPAEAVIHFAARALVPESCVDPEGYLRNNVLSTLNVAQASLEVGIRRLVHSSSCAVYGLPDEVPIRESHPCRPVSPYGESKWLGERVLGQLARYRGLRVTNLRYFNPAGAVGGGEVGEAHTPETHLVPNVVRAIQAGTPVSIYGDDYPTPDGTCIRDFIHVEDLAEAHVAALRYLAGPEPSPVETLNLGMGTGASVREVIAAAERALGRKASVRVEPRRQGDPPALVADPATARRVLGWSARRSLDEMIRSHAQWEARRRS